MRKWGNSYGIIIPQEVLKRKGIKESEGIDVILLKKRNVLKETFGKSKIKKSTEQIMKEINEEMYDI